MPSKRDRFANVSLVILCQSFQALALGGIALFLPVIRKDLDLTFAQGGSLAAVSTLFYALMQIPVGVLTDRLGPKRLFVFGMLGTTLLALTFGLVTEYWQAIVNQGLSGVFRAFLFAPGLGLIARWFPPEKRAMAMGLYLIGGFSGNLVLDIVGPMMVANFDWRLPFLIFSPLGTVAALVLWRMGKETRASAATKAMNVAQILRLFRLRLMWTCGGIQYVRLAVQSGLAFWLPSLLVEEKGLSLAAAGLVIAARAALIAPSNVVGGYASDRLKNPPLVIGFSLVVLMVTTVLMGLSTNIIVVMAAIAVNSFFVQTYFGPLFAAPIEILGERNSGTCTGFGNLFANTGAFTFTYLLGVLKDATGAFLPGFVALALMCAVGLGFTVVLARIRRAALAQSSLSLSPEAVA